VTRPLVLVGGAFLGLVAVILASRRALDVVQVEGRSMTPLLQPGDHLLVEALTFRSRQPKVGDVVLASDPREPARELIKRVAAVDSAAGTVLLAGDAPGASTDSRTFGPVALATIRWRVAGRYWPRSRTLP
jgi:nickel-type superoxide dismutase maturation protease